MKLLKLIQQRRAKEFLMKAISNDKQFLMKKTHKSNLFFLRVGIVRSERLRRLFKSLHSYEMNPMLPTFARTITGTEIIVE